MGKSGVKRGGENLFYGQNRHGIDPKGRVILPTKYREKLGEVFYITKGLASCLFVYPESEWSELKEKLDALPMSTGGDVQRFFYTNMAEVSADKQGRVLLPSHLREYASLDKDVVIAGVGKRIEIWDAKTFDDMNALPKMDPDEILMKMESLGI